MSLKHSLFHALAIKHQDEIYEYARYLLRNASDAEDVAQEVLLRAWSKMGTFNILSARSWIKRTTHNACIDLIRKREATTNKEYPLESIEQKPESADGPEKQAETQELQAYLHEVIEQLPDNLRNVFVLHELQGHNHRQISKILQIPVNTSKTHLMRARQQLRSQLKAFEPAHEK